MGVLTCGGADPQWCCRLSQCGLGGERCCVGGWGWGYLPVGELTPSGAVASASVGWGVGGVVWEAGSGGTDLWGS